MHAPTFNLCFRINVTINAYENMVVHKRSYAGCQHRLKSGNAKLFSIISIVPHILFSSYVTQAMCSRDSFEVICSGNEKYSLVGHIQLVYN